MTVRRVLAAALTFALLILPSAAIGREPLPAGGVPIGAQSSTDQKISHTFRFDARKALNGREPRTVHLPGSFNHWSRTDQPMTRGADGIYTATLELLPGIYHYKFFVDGETWFVDPDADKSLEDKDDHNNSGVIVGTDWRKLPAATPNEIDPRWISHDATKDSDANVASDSLLRLRLTARAGDVERITAHYRAAGESEWKHEQLYPADQSMGMQTYGAVVTIRNGSRAEYYFQLADGSTTDYLASGMLYPSAETARQKPYAREMKLTFATPDWAKHAVWYQIFPERFRNGDPSNDPPNTKKWTSKWFASLEGEAPGEQNLYSGAGNVWKRRYGGDFQGVREKLPYLRSLGITAIYFNPIFQADSMHKYDTRDYRHVEDFFGVKGSANELTSETEDPATWQWSASDKVFLDFVAEAHRQGFKVIIDGVFNHVGTSHPWFQDVLKNGKKSKYADWFEITDWGNGGTPGKPGGVQWNGWGGKKNGGLPVLKKDPKTGLAHGPYEHIMAITRRWLAPDGDVSRGVDGWRLDAANEVPHAFWIEWRKLVKSVNPDAIIVGELWGWSQPWLSGDQFDCVMNYQFAMPSQSFFVDDKTAIPPSKFGQRLNAVFYNYPLQVVLAQQNLYDSHDTDRFVSRFLNPDRRYDQANRSQEAGSTYDSGKPKPIHFVRARQAVAFQMAFAGAPMVYYGDEAGMWSSDDPNDRMPMWWDDLGPFDEPEYKFDREHFAFYQRAIAVRNHLPALQTGSFRPVLTDDSRGVYAFARADDRQTVYVVVNRGDKPGEIAIPVASSGALIDWMNADQAELVPVAAENVQGRPALRAKAKGYSIEDGKVRISLPAYGAAILAPAESAR